MSTPDRIDASPDVLAGLDAWRDLPAAQQPGWPDAEALATEQSTGLDSPASLAPGRWAAAAAHIRFRVNDLTRWAFLAVLAVFLYTVAEVAVRPRLAWVALVAGVAVYLTAFVGALSTVFFSA